MFEMSRAPGELSWLEREMADLLGDVLSPSSPEEFPRGTYPAVNAWEDADAYHVEAELPGLRIEDLDLSVVEQQLSIRGERRIEEPAGVAWHRRERSFGKFARVIDLPAFVDSEKVTAAFTHGVLRIALPKLQAAKPRKIDVKRIESKN